MTTTQARFPEELPTREQPPPVAASSKKFFYIPKWSSFSLRHCENGATRGRRIAMILILLSRLAQSILSILSAAFRHRIAESVIFTILTIISLWFVASCLAIIGDAVGERRALGMTWNRKHFDIFLWVMVVIHLGMVVVALIIYFRIAEYVSLALWLMIFAVAWIAGSR